MRTGYSKEGVTLMNFNAIMPILGKAITGNIGGAVEEGMKALGLIPTHDREANKRAFNKALATASPEQLVALKEAEIKYTSKMKQMDLDLEQVLANDRDSARKREIAIKDKTPQIVGVLLMFGFFSLLGTLMFVDIPPKNQQVLHIMLGSLGTMATAVANYYFGSSSGSKSKDDKIARMRF